MRSPACAGNSRNRLKMFIFSSFSKLVPGIRPLEQTCHDRSVQTIKSIRSWIEQVLASSDAKAQNDQLADRFWICSFNPVFFACKSLAAFKNGWIQGSLSAEDQAICEQAAGIKCLNLRFKA